MNKQLLPAIMIAIIVTFTTDISAQNTRTRQKQDSGQRGKSRNNRSISSDTTNLRRSMKPHTNDMDSMPSYRNDSIPRKQNMPGK